MTNTPGVYWDSCIWLAVLNGEVDGGRDGEALLDRASKGRLKIYTSTITFVECRFIRQRNSGRKRLQSEENEKKLMEFFRQEFIQPIPLSQRISFKAARILRETEGFDETVDAIHLATALEFNIGRLHTNDAGHLLPLSNRFKCNDGSDLIICKPGDVADNDSLFRTVD